MALEAKTASRVLGCDVGKAEIVVCDSRDETIRTIANRALELAAFAASLGPDCLVICEATGGYEDRLLAALLAAGIAAHRADARKVKAFIRSFGILGKSDAIDARALARYGRERHQALARWQGKDPVRAKLQALVLTRDDLVAQRVACSNRLKAPGAEPVAPYLQPLLACLQAQIRELDAAIAATLRETQALRCAQSALCSIAGVGAQTAAALIALMPELGQIGHKQAAALAGLAPHPKQSGATDAYRRTRGGRPQVKRALFMAALTAARHEPALRLAYQRLKSAGKKPIVAITAIMRKIVVIANARLRDAFKAAKIANQLS